MTRPIDVSLFTDEFSAFFDLMTFREIFHLRQLVLSGEGFVERFLGLLTLSLLHGPSSSFLSTYSSPYISLDPDAQELLNRRRGQYPTHRAVAPRILKKAAFALRDGVPSRFRKIGSQLNVSQALPWDMPAINTGAVSLSVVNWALLARSCAMDSISDVSLRALEQSKSLKRARIYSRGGQWLREWFAGVDMRDVSVAKPLRDLLNEVLLEAARITRPQGRLVFEFPVEEIRSEVSAIIQQDLARFWHQEALLDYEVPTQQSAAQGGCLIVLRRIP
jgi:hypothetical protein